MKNIALFASGSGTNVENIINHFKDSSTSVKLVLSNNPNAFVLERCKRLDVPFHVFSREEFYDNDSISQLLLSKNIELIVLAGFLWLIPPHLVKNFNNKIINIHPALLPKFGGKGMYGHHVHEAVVKNKEIKTGITIHLVNEKYDDGAIIFQSETPVDPSDTPEDVANKIHALEQAHFPKVIESILNS